MNKYSIFVNVINGLDITIEDKKISGRIHEIQWQDILKLSYLIRQTLEALYPEINLNLKEFLGDANNQNAAGIEIIISESNVDPDDINKSIVHVINSIRHSNNHTKDLFADECDQLSEDAAEKLKPIIQNFVESNPKRKIYIPVCIDTGTLNITVSGDYRKVKNDKVYLENIEKIGQIDMLGKFTTKFSLTNPKDKTMTIFYDPKVFSQLHDIQGKNEIASFELQPIQDNGKTDYMLKSIKRISQTLDVF